MKTLLIIRSLLVKGYLYGCFEADLIAKLNAELRSINLQVIQNHTKNLLVLKDMEPMLFDNPKILDIIENHIKNDIPLDKQSIETLAKLNWYSTDKFTDIFLIQNEDYLLEKFSDKFRKCKFCDLVFYGQDDAHSFCIKTYQEHLADAASKM